MIICPYVTEKENLIEINPLSAKPTKWSNTLKQFVGDHFAWLVLKGLTLIMLKGMNFKLLLNEIFSQSFKPLLHLTPNKCPSLNLMFSVYLV